MSLRTKLLLLVTISIAASVGAVAWLIAARTRESFREADQERTSMLVEQFRREFNREAGQITRGLEAVAGSESMFQMALILADGGDSSAYVHAAGGYASAQRLDFLDLLTPSGIIISSAHWPARFGYPERWFLEQGGALPQETFLKQMETPRGSALSILCIRTVKARGSTFYLVGGRKLDAALLESLSTPAGMRVFIYSDAPQSEGELLSAAAGNVDASKLKPLIQEVQLQPQKDATANVEWNPEEEEVFHAMALPGFGGQSPAVLLIGNSLQQQRAQERRIAKLSLLLAGCGVLVGVIVSGVIATRMVRPINELARAAEKIGQGAWETRVEPSSEDEIGRLAVAFNKMTEELTGQKERLLQSERVAAWRELARRLAHELKNPLFPLQITVENLLRSREAPPAQFDEIFRESTATLLEEIANLKTIISRFSDFSKMPAPQLEPVDLNDLVLSVVQLFQSQFMREPGRIYPDLKLEKVAPVNADPALLRRVVENLVLNAIDAMPNGGRLTFRTGQQERYATFELSDTGSGLTPEECERLFTPYYTSKQHGTGLGLAIAQSVISDHQGKISVSSKKGEGTTFHIELPLWDSAKTNGDTNQHE